MPVIKNQNINFDDKPNQFQQKVQEIADDIVETLVIKNHDHGNSFGALYEKYGDLSVAIRLSDKLNRFETLIGNEQMLNNESIEDTLRDLVGYGILALAERRGGNNA